MFVVCLLILTGGIDPALLTVTKSQVWLLWCFHLWVKGSKPLISLIANYWPLNRWNAHGLPLLLLFPLEFLSIYLFTWQKMCRVLGSAMSKKIEEKDFLHYTVWEKIEIWKKSNCNVKKWPRARWATFWPLIGTFCKKSTSSELFFNSWEAQRRLPNTLCTYKH